LGNDAARNTALRRAAGVEIAQFTVKPSNGASEVDLDTIEFTLTGSTEFNGFDEYDVTLTINDETQDLTLSGTNGADYVTYTTSRFKTLPAEGVTVKVVIEPEVTGKVVLTGLMLNGAAQNKTFSKYLVQSLVSFESLDDAGAASYVYKLSVDGDSSDAITGYVVYTSTGNCVAAFS
jgi:hypothetical protein